MRFFFACWLGLHYYDYSSGVGVCRGCGDVR